MTVIIENWLLLLLLTVLMTDPDGLLLLLDPVIISYYYYWRISWLAVVDWPRLVIINWRAMDPLLLTDDIGIIGLLLLWIIIIVNWRTDNYYYPLTAIIGLLLLIDWLWPNISWWPHWLLVVIDWRIDSWIDYYWWTIDYCVDLLLWHYCYYWPS